LLKVNWRLNYNHRSIYIKNGRLELINRRPEIDGLRAIAVLSVVFFHAEFPYFSGGFIGVDIFFVISGYLIASIIISDQKTKCFSISNFYERRLRRILPALFVMILLCIPIGWILLLPRDMRDFTESVAAAAIFISNHLFHHESGYFDTASYLKPLLHTWSLSVEVQYYIIFPIVLFPLLAIGTGYVIPAISVIAIGSLITSEWLLNETPESAYFLLPSRLWEPLFGALAALYVTYSKGINSGRLISEVGGGLGLILIMVALVMYEKETTFPGIFALLPTVGAVLIILFCSNSTYVGRLLCVKALVFMGLISYSFYLWHYPIFVFYRHLKEGVPNPTDYLLLIFLALLAAYISWAYVERPFRSSKYISSKLFAVLTLVFVTLFIAVGLLGKKTGGFEERFSPALKGDTGQLTFHREIDERYFDCEPKELRMLAPKWEGYTRCKQTALGVPDVVLLGDSHAEHLFVGVAESLPEKNVAFHLLNLRDEGGTRGSKVTGDDLVISELMAFQRTQLVIMSFHFVGWSELPSDDTQRLVDRARILIQRVRSSGKEVILVGDTPKFPVESEHCVYRNTAGKNHHQCDISIESGLKQRGHYEKVVTALLSGTTEQLPFIDVFNLFCNQTKCSMVRGNWVLYRDNNHLNLEGSRFVGKHVISQLGARY